MQTIYEAYSPEETFEFGKRLGEAAKPGDVYALAGDLGVGKTVLAKGMTQKLNFRFL